MAEVVGVVAALVVLAATWGRGLPTVVVVVVAVFLVGAVLAAVHHAEVVAHKVGEPYGSLVLAVAVTVIEVALIVTLMISGGKDTSTLARDTWAVPSRVKRVPSRSTIAWGWSRKATSALLIVFSVRER